MKRFNFKSSAALVALVAILAGSVFLIYAFLSVASSTAQDLVATSGIGAFLGAFFAFLFVRLGNAMSRIYERAQKHHTALVKLEHYLNQLLGEVDDNIYLARKFAESLSPPVQNGVVRISGNRLFPLEVRRDLLLELMNLDLINDLFVLLTSIRKLDSSLRTVNSTYEGVVQSTLGSRQDVDSYAASSQAVVARLHEGVLFMEHTKAEILENLARVRVLSQDLPFLAWLNALVVSKSYPRGMDKALAVEREKLNRELRESEAASTVQLEQIFGRGAKQDP
jgi:hypothetical protein